MKKNNKIIYKLFKFLAIFTFIIFITLYLSQVSGYYEYSNYKKMTLTEQQIKSFENDIKNGKDIDLKKYTKDNQFNYNNYLSKIGLNVTDVICKSISSGVESFFNFIIKMIEEK